MSLSIASAWRRSSGVSLLGRLSLRPRARAATGHGPLPGEVPLELGQRPEYVEDQRAAGGSGVNPLSERAEAGPSLPAQELPPPAAAGSVPAGSAAHLRLTSGNSGSIRGLDD